MFDNIPSYCLSIHTIDEVSCYLCTEPEDVSNDNLLHWWHNHRHQYPCLYQMALDYHTIPCKCLNCYLPTHYDAHLLYFPTTPGSSVDVEHIFSQGRLILLYVCNCLTSKSTCTLVCLGDWSACGLVRDCDIKSTVVLPDVLGAQEPEYQWGWDKSG
jgi:hypothetical protein